MKALRRGPPKRIPYVGFALAAILVPESVLQSAEYHHGTHALETHQASQSAQTWGGRAAHLAVVVQPTLIKIVTVGQQESGEQPAATFWRYPHTLLLERPPNRAINVGAQESGEQPQPSFARFPPATVVESPPLRRSIYAEPQEDPSQIQPIRSAFPPASLAPEAPPLRRGMVGEPQEDPSQIAPVFWRVPPSGTTQPTLAGAEYVFGTHEAQILGAGQSASIFPSKAVHAVVLLAPALRSSLFAAPQEDPTQLEAAFWSHPPLSTEPPAPPLSPILQAAPQEDPTQLDASFWSQPPASTAPATPPLRKPVSAAPQLYEHQDPPRFWHIPIPSLEPGSKTAIPTGQDAIDGSWVWFTSPPPPNTLPPVPPLAPILQAAPQPELDQPAPTWFHPQFPQIIDPVPLQRFFYEREHDSTEQPPAAIFHPHILPSAVVVDVPATQTPAGRSRRKERWEVEYQGEIRSFRSAAEAHAWLSAQIETVKKSSKKQVQTRKPVERAAKPVILYEGVDVSRWQYYNKPLATQLTAGAHLKQLERWIQARLDDDDDEEAMAVVL